MLACLVCFARLARFDQTWRAMMPRVISHCLLIESEYVALAYNRLEKVRTSNYFAWRFMTKESGRLLQNSFA